MLSQTSVAWTTSRTEHKARVNGGGGQSIVAQRGYDRFMVHAVNYRNASSHGQ